MGSSRGGNRPSRAGLGKYPRTIRDVAESFGRGVPEEVIAARTRTVLVYSDVVVKVPTTEEGMLGNSMEWSTFNDPEGIPVAPCRWHDVDEHMSVLVMDRVTPVVGAFSDATMPWWVSYVDCGQVGHLPNGELVAYDL